MQQIGDAPVEEQYRAKMEAVMKTLDIFFNGEERPRKTGFVLLVFPFNSTDGRCNYMSNGASRDDIVVMLKEQIKRFEGQPELSGNA